MTKQDLVKFVEENNVEILKKLNPNLVRLEEIRIDDLGDVGGIGIYVDDEGDEFEIGYAFSVNNNLGGGDSEGKMEVNGITIYWIGYNI